MIETKNNDIEISLGGGLDDNHVVTSFILVREAFPEWFIPEFKITTIFDSFSHLLWNGGRVKLNNPVSINTMNSRVRFFNERNIGVYFTFSNNILTQEHLADERCNEILTMFTTATRKNGIVLASELLTEYVKEKYHNYQRIFSITNSIYEPAALINLTKEYDLIVIPEEFYTDLEFLRSFPQGQAEILIDNGCVFHCQYKHICYSYISRVNMGQDSLDRQHSKCVYELNGQKPQGIFLSRENVFFLKKETGIKRFKFNSRFGNPNNSIASLREYFLLDEYKQKFEMFMRATMRRNSTDE